MRGFITLSLGLFFFSSLSAHAETYRIVYGSASWNKSSIEIDSAFLFIRDQVSGTTVKVNLDETEPDSSIFAGDFLIELKPGQQFSPEIFIPTEKMRATEDSVFRFQKLLGSKVIQPRPLITKVESNGRLTLDVYDTVEQANAAQAAHEKKLEAERQELEAKKQLVQPVPTAQDLEAAQRAEQKAKLERLAQQAADRDAERIRLEQIERQRQAELERRARELDQHLKKQNQERAKQLAAEALEAYSQGNFKVAEDKFGQSVELDPENREYYFKYAVTLYRNQKYDEALVKLRLAPSTQETELERQYYMALIHLKLKELKPAYDLFSKVALSQHPDLGPSASFYQGLILFAEEKYEEARGPFEKVIDTSKDPKLDQQAEDYIERIAQMIQQKNLYSKKWFMNASGGVMYDSNVLLASDNVTSQGASLQVADFRFMGSGDLEYRAIYNSTQEFGVRVMGYGIYSIQEAASRADPYLGQLSAPWTYKGTAWGKGYRATLRPAAEATMMNFDASGATEMVLSSAIVGLDQTFVMRKDWFSIYSVEVRTDRSGTGAIGDSDADAFRATLRTTQMFMMSPGNKEALQLNLAMVHNNAEGRNVYYNRYELGFNYIRPTKWDASLAAGLTYYLLNFDRSTLGRKDTNMAVNLGLTKPLSKQLSVGLNGSIMNNDSTSTTNDYFKYTLMTNVSYNNAF